MGSITVSGEQYTGEAPDMTRDKRKSNKKIRRERFGYTEPDHDRAVEAFKPDTISVLLWKWVHAWTKRQNNQ